MNTPFSQRDRRDQYLTNYFGDGGFFWTVLCNLEWYDEWNLVLINQYLDVFE